MENSEKVLIDGKIVDSHSHTVLFSSGFSFGDGLFESIRMTEGKMPFLDDHIERLKQGMSVLKMNIPDYYEVDYFRKKINQLIHQNKTGPNARIRLMVYRKSQRGLPPSRQEPTSVIEAIPLAEKRFQLNQEGWTVGLYEEQVKPVTSLSNYKTNNYLISVLASFYRDEHQFDECFLMNDQGNVIEGIVSNIFARYGDTVYTTPVEQGCVNGVMRKQIFRLSSKNIQTKPLTPDDLLQADEIFMTNAIRGIRWVYSFQNKKYQNKTAQYLIKQLNQRV